MCSSDLMEEIMNRCINDPLSKIAGKDVTKYEDYFNRKRYYTASKQVENIEGLPVGDLVKYYLSDGTTICIRPSGTEPKIKFYIEVIVKEPSTAEKACDEIYHKVLEDLDVKL